MLIAYHAFLVTSGSDYVAAADISPDSVMELQSVQIDIDFVINRSDINPAFSDNAGSISAMDSLFNESSSDSTISIRSVSFRGAASPDGGLNLNRALSERRMNSLKNFVIGRYALPDSVLSAQGSEIPWNTFRSLVATTPFAGSERVLEIINQGDDAEQTVFHLHMHLIGGQKLYYAKLS